jgi:dTDP-4-dehydrorhamnose reductase
MLIHGSGQTSWFDFTAAILEEFSLKTELTRTTSAEWKKQRPNSAIRPAYSVLDTSKYTQATGKAMRPWREALHAYRLALES